MGGETAGTGCIGMCSASLHEQGVSDCLTVAQEGVLQEWWLCVEQPVAETGLV